MTLYLDAEFVKAQIGKLRASYPELEDDAEALSIAVETETDVEAILSKVVRCERDSAAFVAAIKSEEEALAERRDRFVRRQEAMRRLAHEIMEAASQTRVTLPTATLSIIKGRPGCIITDAEKLPPDLVRIKREPEKARITEALLRGERIEGAELRNSRPTITIRTN